ncbi:MAG: phasin family protein [Ramlibacter sp.]
MTAKSASTASTAEAQRDTTNGSTPLPELSRQQVARSIDWMAAAFRTGEALQQVNLQMSQRAALLHSQAAENARKATSPTELFQIQSTLAMYQWQEVSRYSQELMLASARAMGQPATTTLGEQGAAASPGAMGGMTDAALGAAAPMVQAWQQMFTGAVADAAQAKH